MRQWLRLLGAVLAVSALAFAVSACSGQDTPDAASATGLSSSAGASRASGASQSSSTAASSSPSEAGVAVDPTTQRAILAAYRGYWAVRVTAQAAPSKGVPKTLATYAVDKAAADVASSLDLYAQQGVEIRGAPELDPRVTAYTPGNPAMATISDCVDSTHWTPVFTATGKSALAPGQPRRVVVESGASTYDGRWVIRTSTAYRDRTC